VTLLVGTEPLITLPLASGQAYFATSTNGVAPGKYSVTANYGGDSNDSASVSSAVSVTVQ
jgi:hypothetical protein